MALTKGSAIAACTGLVSIIHNTHYKLTGESFINDLVGSQFYYNPSFYAQICTLGIIGAGVGLTYNTLTGNLKEKPPTTPKD